MGVRQKEIIINNQNVLGIEIDLPRAPLVVVTAAQGFVMCGYLNIETVEKKGHIAAMVQGVNSVEDLLNAPICALTTAAGACGITLGMKGKEALEKIISWKKKKQL